MKQLTILAASALLLAACSPKQEDAASAPRLCDAFPNYTLGAAINVRQSNQIDTASVAILKQHFNSIVPENCMKSEEIHPAEDTYYWDDADRYVQFGEDNGFQVIGHCLVWHSQCPQWMCHDSEGNLVSAEVLKQHIKDHITTVVTRYKGRITGWDVVNEAIVEDGSYRNSDFYKILGEEFIPWAFECAHEADPDLELYYNDYGMAVPGRREGVVRLIKQLKDRGLRIDAVGLQSHMGLDHPDWEEFELSIKSFIEAGVDVQFTEVDMSALPTVNWGANVSDTEEYQESLNPYKDGLPDSISVVWNERMAKFLSIVDKYADHVKRVTAWGVTDTDSWKNDWPIPGRTDYCLWFDRQGQMKPFLQERMANVQK